MGEDAARRDIVGPSSRLEAGSDGAHEGALRRAFAAGREEYGSIPLPFESFSGRVVELVRRRPGIAGVAETTEPVARYLSRASCADLFLAIACDEGVEGAWEVFTRHFVPRLFGLAMRGGASRSEAEEVVRGLPGDLLARPGRGRTRFGAYDGSGSLLAWLSVQVARRLADRVAARRTASIGSEVARRLDPSADGRDPSEVLLDAETVSFLEEGLRSAWRDLDARERQALLWRFHEGQPLRDIALRLGVSVSQASRVVSGGVETVRSVVLARIRACDPARFRDGDRVWAALRDAVGRHMQRLASSPDLPSCEPSIDGHAPPA